MQENENIESTIENQTEEINISSFLQDDTVQTSTEETTNVNTTTEEQSDDYLSWSDLHEKKVEETNTKEVVGEENKTTTEENKTTTEEESTITEDKAFSVIKSEIGDRFNSVKELKEHLEMLEEQNRLLKESGTANVTNEKLKKLSEYKNLSDERLVLESLLRQGFTEEEAKDAVDRYADNQMLDIEAKKIRKGIDVAIDKEMKNHVLTAQQEEAKLQKEREESIEGLKKYMNTIDTMYGLKIAKDQNGIDSVRKEHIKYITSGSFLNDITENNENLVEASWLWKNREVITKSFFNKGRYTERKEFFDELQQPDITNSTERIKGPDSDDGFNPNKFLQS